MARASPPSREFEIQDLGPKADGICRSEQGPIYLDRTLPGDRVRATIHRGAGGVLRGDVVELLAASPHRVAAPCPNYDVCGGCSTQHAGEAFYRNWKTGLVRDALRRQGLEPERWGEPVFLPDSHRRRVTFAAYKKNNVVTLGYFRRRSHEIEEIAVCLTADPIIMDLRAKLAAPLVSILREGKSADIFIQAVNGQSELVITGPVGRKGTPDLEVHEAIARLAHATKLSRISWRAREHDTAEVMIEQRPLRARFGALDIVLPPQTFLQPTADGEKALVDTVMSLLPKAGRLADLFSGCGTFSGPMLTRGAVDAYESNESAIRALDKAKGARPLKAVQRDLFRNPLQADEAARYDAIVFDPPRAGAVEQATALAMSTVPLLVGVSCNPSTFARDARILVDGGYRLAGVTVVDQFVWSHHVELVAAFTR